MSDSTSMVVKEMGCSDVGMEFEVQTFYCFETELLKFPKTKSAEEDLEILQSLQP